MRPYRALFAAMPSVVRSKALHRVTWICTIGTAVMFGFACLSGPGPDPGPVDYVGTAALGVVGSLAFYRATRMRLELTEGGVRLVRYFDALLVQWNDIADVTASYVGLTILRTDGTRVTIAALARSNWAQWTMGDSVADEAIYLIREELKARLSPP